jgi:hypothetical protein
MVESPNRKLIEMEPIILSPVKASDLELLTGGDIIRPKLKRRFTRLSLQGMKGGGNKFKSNENSQEKKARVSWGNKVTHINQDESITENILEFQEVIPTQLPP